MGSGGCVNSRKDEFVFTEKSDEVLESHETMRSAEIKGQRSVTDLLCLLLTAGY